MGSRASSPAFVGRLEELQILEAASRRAANGEPAVVLVGGEAGVGKTRLVTELTARLVDDGVRVLHGGCVPVGEGTLRMRRWWRRCGRCSPTSAPTGCEP